MKKTGRDYLIQALAGLIVILAISGTTGLGWLLYTLVRRNRLDNVVEAGIRAVSGSFQGLLDMDPIAAVFVFPLIFAGAIVAVLHIWRYFTN